MNEKRYEKRLELQRKTIDRQSEQIKELKFQIDKLKNECEEKDSVINSVDFFREGLIKERNNIEKYKSEYKTLIEELKNMRKILDVTVYKGRWRLVKFLIK